MGVPHHPHVVPKQWNVKFRRGLERKNVILVVTIASWEEKQTSQHQPVF